MLSLAQVVCGRDNSVRGEALKHKATSASCIRKKLDHRQLAIAIEHLPVCSTVSHELAQLAWSARNTVAYIWFLLFGSAACNCISRKLVLVLGHTTNIAYGIFTAISTASGNRSRGLSVRQYCSAPHVLSTPSGRRCHLAGSYKASCLLDLLRTLRDP